MDQYRGKFADLPGLEWFRFPCRRFEKVARFSSCDRDPRVKKCFDKVIPADLVLFYIPTLIKFILR